MGGGSLTFFKTHNVHSATTQLKHPSHAFAISVGANDSYGSFQSFPSVVEATVL